tara:strand:- start:2620 stop:3027 length:408 start_codon:yes stop_codon:yes gene_type:complete
MAYYLAALPVVYFGTQFAAAKAMNAATKWVTTCDDLQNDSAPTIDTAKAIVRLYATLETKHPAYTTLLHLKAALDQLKYISSKANLSARKWRMVRKDFSTANTTLRVQRDRVEQRIRLFNDIMQSAKLQKGSSDQ